MDNIMSTKLNITWRAAHRCQISENDCENVDIPNLCEEVRGRLADAGARRVTSDVLSLGPAAALLHGAALLLLDKANQTLQDTFRLTQKIMLKDYQTVSECTDSEDELEDEEFEEESGATLVSSSKRCADTSDDLVMSKRSKRHKISESNCDWNREVSHVTSDEESDEVGDPNYTQCNTRSQEEDSYMEVEESAVQSKPSQAADEPEFDPRLKLGVMLIYEDYTKPIPNKILVASINPRAKL